MQAIQYPEAEPFEVLGLLYDCIRFIQLEERDFLPSLNLATPFQKRVLSISIRFELPPDERLISLGHCVTHQLSLAATLPARDS